MHRLVRLSFVCLLPCFLQAQGFSQHLLLTPRRLHRLKLDCGRQTERWNNFEQRVKTVADSPERGFELALYGVITGDASACKSAVQWGFHHVSEYRQLALIADWCQPQISNADRVRLLSSSPAARPDQPFASARDVLFHAIVTGQASHASAEQQWSRLLPLIQQNPLSSIPDIYALFEFLDAANTNFHVDLRQDDARLFSSLPLIFMLSLHPEQVEHPDWKERAGGLMMVNLDPNLQASSFVQGWALEDPKLVSDGPGVAYELLWANPYLPGLGYYNMDLWVYDAPSSLFLARSSWDADACWVSIFKGQVDTLHCAAGTLEKTAQFGKLSLIPMKQQCLDITAQPAGTTILSHLYPGRELAWETNSEKLKTRADASGLAMLSSVLTARVCQVAEKR